MVWYFYIFNNFPSFVVIHTIKGFGLVNKAEVDICLLLKTYKMANTHLKISQYHLPMKLKSKQQ